MSFGFYLNYSDLQYISPQENAFQKIVTYFTLLDIFFAHSNLLTFLPGRVILLYLQHSYMEALYKSLKYIIKSVGTEVI